MDSLTKDNWKEVASRYRALDYAAGAAAWDAAWDAAGDATSELIGMHILLDAGKTLLFAPLFLDL